MLICRKGRDNCEPPQEVSRKKTAPSDAILGTVNSNIRLHQKQRTPRSYAHVYVAPGLHSY